MTKLKHLNWNWTNNNDILLQLLAPFMKIWRKVFIHKVAFLVSVANSLALSKKRCKESWKHCYWQHLFLLVLHWTIFNWFQAVARRTFVKWRSRYWYSVSLLVVPKLNSYLVSWIGSNLAAPTSALPPWILTPRVPNESWHYRGCCIRVWLWLL